MQVGYLEIVTPEVDAVSAAYAASHGVTFSEPIAALGGAVVASLAGGGQLGIRGRCAPMRSRLYDPTCWSRTSRRRCLKPKEQVGRSPSRRCRSPVRGPARFISSGALITACGSLNESGADHR